MVLLFSSFLDIYVSSIKLFQKITEASDIIIYFISLFLQLFQYYRSDPRNREASQALDSYENYSIASIYWALLTYQALLSSFSA